MKAKASAPGKIVISGEYSVLDGAHAIVMSTTQKAFVTIEEINHSENIFYTSAMSQSFDFKINKDYSVIWANDNPGKYGSFIEAIFQHLQIDTTHTIAVSIQTKDFYWNEMKLGIGSSSAIAVAMVNAFNDFFNLKMDSYEVLNNAIELHYRSQKYKGSGIDIACSFSGMETIQATMSSIHQKNWKELSWPKDLYMQVLFTQKEIPTKNMVEGYQAMKKHINIREIIQHLIRVANEISSFWLSQDVSNIIKSLKHYDLLMREMDEISKLGIFSNVHNQIHLIAKQQNVFYKPSGAGHGDIGLAFSESLEDLSRFMKKIKESKVNASSIIVR
jgi:phosphomevalonate kinase